MTLYLAVQTEHIDGVDFIRERLGNSGTIRNTVTPVLRQASREGARAARVAAPDGSTGKLQNAIEDDAFVFRVRGDTITARFGVQPVRNPGRGSPLYPVYVHEGTGLYGRLHRVIAAKKSPYMKFPGGGKPWPTTFAGTGVVRKRTVRGQRPNPYMTRAYEVAAAYVETHLNDIVDDLVE